MENDKSELSEIIGVASRHAGAFVGKAAAIGKQIAGSGVSGGAAVRNLLSSRSDKAMEPASEASGLVPKAKKARARKGAASEPAAALKSELAAARRELAEVRSEAENVQSQVEALQAEKESLISELEQARDEAKDARAREIAVRARAAALKSELAAARRELEEVRSEAENVRSQLEALQAEKESLISELERARDEVKEMRGREDAMRTRAAALESELAAARRELERTRSAEKAAKSQLSSEVSGVRTEIESALSDWGQEEAAVVSTEEKVESSMEATAAVGDEEVSEQIEEPQSQPLVTKTEAPGPAEVSPEEVRAAVFPNAADRIIFAKALSDISSQDDATRADAARAMAGVRHELSLRALVTQMAREPSAQVRQQCIKALAFLEMKEGLGAVERALSDRASSVRLAAVWGLYRLAGAESAAALADMFCDEDEEVRRRAVTCIGWLGQKQATVETIGYLRSRQVVRALIGCLNDPEESIRKAALGALEAITGKKMGGTFPADEKSHQRLIERWRKWWKEELLG